MESKLEPISKVSRILGLSRQILVYHITTTKKLRAIKKGRVFWIDIADIPEFLKKKVRRETEKENEFTPTDLCKKFSTSYYFVRRAMKKGIIPYTEIRRGENNRPFFLIRIETPEEEERIRVELKKMEFPEPILDWKS